jgi:hypothetical protein
MDLSKVNIGRERCVKKVAVPLPVPGCQTATEYYIYAQRERKKRLRLEEKVGKAVGIGYSSTRLYAYPHTYCIIMYVSSDLLDG